MKKLKYGLLLMALTVIFASLVTISCPSEPEEGRKVADPDIILKAGEIYYKFNAETDPKVVQGHTYTVVLNVIDCDEIFIGAHMGAKLCYYHEDFDETKATGKNFADDDKDVKILSGWTDSAPDVVIDPPCVYTWTFKAGEANKDDRPIASPATFPGGNAVQFFFMQAQDDKYKKFPSYFEFNIKGTLTLEEEITPAGTPTSTKVLDMDFTGEGHDAARGIGNIQGADFELVKKAGVGAYLAVTVTDCDINKQTPIDEQWAIGSIGNFAEVNGNNPNAKINIPKSATIGKNTFTVNVPVKTVLRFVKEGETYIFVNIWDADETGSPKISKVELFEYKVEE